jgi:hypothetical protein
MEKKESPDFVASSCGENKERWALHSAIVRVLGAEQWVATVARHKVQQT